MNKENPLQDIYDIMQINMIQMQCFASSVMNVEHKEKLKQIVFRAGRYTQQYHSAVCSCGNLITELSVWRTLKIYFEGYLYRYIKETTAKKVLDIKISEIIYKLFQLTAKLNAYHRAHRIAESYLDLLIEFRYLVQGFK